MKENLLLEINGKSRSVPPVASIRELLQFLGVGQQMVAVELNRKIIRRKDWDATPVADADKVEIVQFVGGG